MQSMSSIKIATGVKDLLSQMKEHPRETYSDVIERLVTERAPDSDGRSLFHIPLWYVRIRDTIHTLDPPIELSCERDNEDFILYNHEYHLLASASNLHEALVEITDEFEENWKDYVEQDIHKLSPGAQLFRQKLISLLSEEYTREI
ncbi:MAG: hypothetical protein D5R96_07750 [Methanocalculus sp. MSAO_Arc2]|uniref:Uncharacterized protein n=1 Tax=Methanocalculus chunghsingensis TaxID=156457 RepID=A0A8J7W639_9EURY|nr:hypothetical protein [Methanocalculus chunghsingensis]MBR1368243.1 hypothetical protein [Methanocalculus chunghsingensis]RQD80963.1 MAG: hypothetical protein D5R96_07750 [Methanocalculus sp. MSAO_Arc2]